MKLKYYVAGALLATSISATSAVVNIQSGFAYAIVDSSGNALNVGDGYLAVGYFSSLTDAAIATTNGAGLAADFQVFAGASSSFGASGFGGLFVHEANTGSRIDGTNPFVGQSIYFIAANGADLASSTEAVIYRFGQAFVADPEAPTPPSAIDLTPSLTASNYLIGTPDGNYNFGIEIDAAQMGVLIPEPSVALLGAFGILGLLRRRR